ncbi:MAG TPA: hypothetical protein VK483_03090 [Chitinophagaceae bacterium]|nr:hypothetical protein [Chitinophagaceae bacterium]
MTEEKDEEKSKNKAEVIVTKGEEMEIQLHIAEYNAMTMRETYLINIQYILPGSIVVWITVMVGQYISHPTSLICWGTILGAQIFFCISAWLLNEEFIIVNYLETHVRPLLVDLLKNKNIWKYQFFIQNSRKKTHWLWEYTGVIIICISILAISFTLKSWKLFDTIGLIINVVVLSHYIFRLTKALKIKWRWESAMRVENTTSY